MSPASPHSRRCSASRTKRHAARSRRLKPLPAEARCPNPGRARLCALSRVLGSVELYLRWRLRANVRPLVEFELRHRACRHLGDFGRKTMRKFSELWIVAEEHEPLGLVADFVN